jgi:hypothetical protein
VLGSTASGQLENTNDDDVDDNPTIYMLTQQLKANYKVRKCKDINKANKITRTTKQCNLYLLATVHLVQSY